MNKSRLKIITRSRSRPSWSRVTIISYKVQIYIYHCICKKIIAVFLSFLLQIGCNAIDYLFARLMRYSLLGISFKYSMSHSTLTFDVQTSQYFYRVLHLLLQVRVTTSGFYTRIFTDILEYPVTEHFFISLLLHKNVLHETIHTNHESDLLIFLFFVNFFSIIMFCLRNKKFRRILKMPHKVENSD